MCYTVITQISPSIHSYPSPIVNTVKPIHTPCSIPFYNPTFLNTHASQLITYSLPPPHSQPLDARHQHAGSVRHPTGQRSQSGVSSPTVGPGQHRHSRSIDRWRTVPPVGRSGRRTVQGWAGRVPGASIGALRPPATRSLLRATLGE